MIWIAFGFFPVSEIVLALVRRSRGGSARSDDRGSMRLLWMLIFCGVCAGVLSSGVSATRIPASARALNAVGLSLVVGGLVLRWTAILTLGRLFTVDVAIHDDHVVVQSGLYRFMRHPSYTGLLVAFVGLGVLFGNWLSIVVLIVPVFLGILYRVHHEEKVLLASLGTAYRDYCARTKRFVPGLI